MSLSGLQDVVICKNAEAFLADSIKALRQTMNDRSSDVRVRFYSVVRHWMTKMEVKSLRGFEHHFILFLLNGIADENQEISAQSIEFLEAHGKRMKEVLQVLEEDEFKPTTSILDPRPDEDAEMLSQ